MEQKGTNKEQANHKIRKLIPLEALYKGSEEDFYRNAYLAGLSDHQMNKQAGNAISVNTACFILYWLVENKLIILQ